MITTTQKQNHLSAVCFISRLRCSDQISSDSLCLCFTEWCQSSVLNFNFPLQTYTNTWLMFSCQMLVARLSICCAIHNGPFSFAPSVVGSSASGVPVCFSCRNTDDFTQTSPTTVDFFLGVTEQSSSHSCSFQSLFDFFFFFLNCFSTDGSLLQNKKLNFFIWSQHFFLLDFLFKFGDLFSGADSSVTVLT